MTTRDSPNSKLSKASLKEHFAHRRSMQHVTKPAMERRWWFKSTINTNRFIIGGVLHHIENSAFCIPSVQVMVGLGQGPWRRASEGSSGPSVPGAALCTGCST